jgi:hypothetical protein
MCDTRQGGRRNLICHVTYFVHISHVYSASQILSSSSSSSSSSSGGGSSSSSGL